jgi:ubiquinone/menaquinone biosynthesis C-methylase UbiE
MQTALPADAVTYHASLAAGWDRRYQKRSFQAREAVVLKCLQGRDLTGSFWLDAGCGTGTLSRCLVARGCRVLGLDAAPEMVCVAAQLAKSYDYSDRLKFARVETIAHLPIDDRSLDGLLCSSVLEYVSDPGACLREFSRVLKAEGLLLISVPNRNSLVRQIQLACHHLASLVGTDWARFLDYSRQQYSGREFKRLLAHAGFWVEETVPFGSPLPALAQRSRTWASLLMFVAHKL